MYVLNSFISHKTQMQFEWHREDADIPRNAEFDNNHLILNHVREEDTGRYVCHMTGIDGFVTKNYVELRIKREYRKRRRNARKWWRTIEKSKNKKIPE
jgi:hypothetical protein